MANWFGKNWKWNFWAKDPEPFMPIEANRYLEFLLNNGSIDWDDCYTVEGQKLVYEKCSPVASMIDNMADAFVNCNIEALTDRKNGTVNKEWQKLLDRPNNYQDQQQFFKQLYTYRKMFGWCYVMKVKAVGFDIPSSLWILPPWLLEVRYEQKGVKFLADKSQKRQVYLKWAQKSTLLDNDDLILFTDVTNLFNEQTWLPLPRIYSKKSSMTLVMSILEAKLTLIQKKGAIGVISNDQPNAGGIPIPMSPEQKRDLQQQWEGKYGLTREQHQMIFTNSRVSYTPLIFDAAQLQLEANYLSAIKDISEGLHYPMALSAHSDQSTYNNILWAQKMLYQDAIIPDAISIFKTLERGLNMQGVVIWNDYQHVDAMQVGAKDKADARRALMQSLTLEWNMNIITRNMMLDKLNEDQVNDPLFNKYKYQLTPEEQGIIMQNNEQGKSGQGSTGGN